MSRAINMSNVCNIAFESKFTYITIEYFCFFILFSCLNSANISVCIYFLISTNQSATMSSILKNRIIDIFLGLIIFIFILCLKGKFFSTKIIYLRYQFIFYFLWRSSCRHFIRDDNLQIFIIKQAKKLKRLLLILTHFMKIKKTNSFEVKQQQNQQSGVGKHSGKAINLDVLDNPQKQKNRSNDYGLQSLYRSQTSVKIPRAIRNTIKLKASGHKPSKKRTNATLKLSKKIKQIRQYSFVCEICECQYDPKQKAQLSICQHSFCQSCLQHYAIYKVGMFEEIQCPDESCKQIINQRGSLYKNLPADIKKKYQKIHAFYQAAKDPNLHLCPNEKCEDGFLRLKGKEQGSVACSKCREKFCVKCFFKAHEGPCEGNEIEFFEKNLKYRQCVGCKNVVQRSQGCNHMTCICGYQFCYLCGTKWNGYGHLCGQQNQVNAAEPQEQNCCMCLHQDNPFNMLIKLIVKATICFPIWLLALIITLLKIIIFGIFFLILVIFVGIFCASCQFVCQLQDQIVKVLLIVFFPVAMIIGIFIAFSDIYCETFTEQTEASCQEFQECTNGLFRW